jgi:hypothetical protein
MPQHASRSLQLGWIIGAGMLALLAAGLAAGTLRDSLKKHIQKYFQETPGLCIRFWIRNMRRVFRGLRYKIETIGQIRLAYDPAGTIFTREYYLYCAGLLREAFTRGSAPLNVILGNGIVLFCNCKRTVRIDLQLEHTLVKPGGRDSSAARPGKVSIEGSSDSYLVRLQNYEYLMSLDLILEYSLPNKIHVESSGLFDTYCRKTIHVEPLLYDVDFGGSERPDDVITLFHDVRQSRRGSFLDNAKQAGLPLRNVRGLFEGSALKQLYKKTKILVNIHQTDHHDTLEELRILPALLCGVVIVSEDVPLREHVPYSRFMIWSSLENMVETVRSVYENYDHYYKKIFNDLELVNVLTEMKRNNRDNVEKAIQKLFVG